jgi:hypothetical protein
LIAAAASRRRDYLTEASLRNSTSIRYKKKGRDLSHLEGDLPRFLGKGKRSIDLESVVLKKNEK